MLIPKSFDLGSRTYTVQVLPTMRRRGIMGATYFKEARIEIGKRSKITGVAYRQEDINDTFWHELTHAILDDMDSDLVRNEAFVTAFANRLNQAVSTAKL
jgi:hypothetical protein